MYRVDAARRRGVVAERMLQRGVLDPTAPNEGESFTDLLVRPHARVVHIVSSASPDPSMYDQADDEVVIVLRGSATLEVAGERVDLATGDYVVLPAHTEHRVVRTEAGTEWLAVHVTPVIA